MCTLQIRMCVYVYCPNKSHGIGAFACKLCLISDPCQCLKISPLYNIIWVFRFRPEALPQRSSPADNLVLDHTEEFNIEPLRVCNCPHKPHQLHRRAVIMLMGLFNAEWQLLYKSEIIEVSSHTSINDEVNETMLNTVWWVKQINFQK